MNNLMLTSIAPLKINSSNKKSKKVEFYSSALITFSFISVIGLLSLSTNANEVSLACSRALSLQMPCQGLRSLYNRRVGLLLLGIVLIKLRQHPSRCRKDSHARSLPFQLYTLVSAQRNRCKVCVHAKHCDILHIFTHLTGV